MFVRRSLAALACMCVCERARVCMWSTFHKIKDDIDSVTSQQRAVGNDSCTFNRCPEETGTSALFVRGKIIKNTLSGTVSSSTVLRSLFKLRDSLNVTCILSFRV